MTNDHAEEITRAYQAGESCTDIGARLGFKRTTVKEFLRRKKLIRTQSAAGKLKIQQGKGEKAIAAMILASKTTNRYNPAKAPWKGCPEKHPRWKKDRSTLKRKRHHTEERQFFRTVLAFWDYTCQLTGQRGGKLSVHHIKPVYSHPELRYEITNVIVVTKAIHKHFHRLFTFKSTAAQWYRYVEEGLFNADALN